MYRPICFTIFYVWFYRASPNVLMRLKLLSIMTNNLVTSVSKCGCCFCFFICNVLCRSCLFCFAPLYSVEIDFVIIMYIPLVLVTSNDLLRLYVNCFECHLTYNVCLFLHVFI